MRVYIIGVLIGFVSFGCEVNKDSENNKPEAWVEYASPQSVGLNKDSLKQIDEVIKRLTQERKIPGAAALVAKDGKIVYQTSYGFQDVEKQTSMDTTDIFRIASMTKPIISVAVLQLYEKGKLKLDDPVSKYISSFGEPKVITKFNKQDTTWEARKASREVTIHDLLSHTSGISYGFVDPRFSAIYKKSKIPDLSVASDKTIQEMTDSLGKLPLAHEPGERFTYGLNTDVLGRIVEIASGMDLEKYVHENITGPLSMDDTRFFYDNEVSDRFTSVYRINPKDSGIVKIEPNELYDPNYPVAGAKKYYSGGSGMSSTPHDYFIFSQALLNGGEYKGTRILEDSTVQLMSSNQIGDKRFPDNSSFGYGLRIVKEKDEAGNEGAVVQLGWSGAFNTYYFINPKEKIIGIIMSQVLMNPYGGELIDGFMNAIESASVEEEMMVAN